MLAAMCEDATLISVLASQKRARNVDACAATHSMRHAVCDPTRPDTVTPRPRFTDSAVVFEVQHVSFLSRTLGQRLNCVLDAIFEARSKQPRTSQVSHSLRPLRHRGHSHLVRFCTVYPWCVRACVLCKCANRLLCTPPKSLRQLFILRRAASQ